MPTFICAKCGCIDNTAISSYWALRCFEKELNYTDDLLAYAGKPLCSECGCVKHIKKQDGTIVPIVTHGKWHGMFPKQAATEEDKQRVGSDGLIH